MAIKTKSPDSGIGTDLAKNAVPTIIVHVCQTQVISSRDASVRKQVEIFYDPEARKLTILFEPRGQGDTFQASHEGDFVLIKRATGEVIGFEKLNYSVEDTRNFLFSFEISR